jgi:hypothetical protein
MDLHTRLIAPSFRRIDSDKNIFDLNAFIKRILLFETYIIDSYGLTEIPYLLRAFSFDGLLELLESGAFRLNCYVKRTASLGPSMFVDQEAQHKLRPMFHYSFAQIVFKEIYQHVNMCLQEIEPEIELPARRIVRLRRAIYSSLEHPQGDKGSLSLSSTKNDLVSSPDLLANAVAMAFNKRLNAKVSPTDIEISIKYETEYEFRAISNLQKRFGIDKATAHKIIESACGAIALRNDRIEQMEQYSALSGFTDVDLPIFCEKLEFLASTLSSVPQEERFQRIIELTGLPQIKDTNTHIDAKQLIKLRQSTECVEFRHWLSTTDALSNSEIVHQVRSFSEAIGRIIGGTPGRVVRFLFTLAVGSLHPPVGTLVSIPLSIIDEFILEKIFPRSGVAAFVDDMYPSLFEKHQGL